MHEADIRQWRTVNIAFDALGWIWRAARKWWVVSIPLATCILMGIFLPDAGLLGTVVWGLATYITIKKWRESRGKVRQARAVRAEEFGSVEALNHAEHYERTWPEVARNSGLCQRRQTFGAGTIRAASEALRTLGPTAKLDALRSGSPFDDLDVPRVLSVRPSPLGVTLEVEMLAGQEVRSYERAAEAIGHQWGVESVRVVLGRPGVVSITPVTESPLGQSEEITPETVPAMESLKAVQVGWQEDGLPWMFPLDQSHSVVGGVPGSGKSVFLNGLLAGVAARPDVQIIGIDCAGGVELADWSSRFFEFATNQFEAIESLSAVWAEHERRILWLRAHGHKSVANAGYSPDLPLLLVIIDEAAQLFRHDSSDKEEKARGDQLNSLVTRLVTVSRKTGISVVLATQRPMSSVISTNIRDNMQNKVCFRVMTPESATAVLGDGASYAPMSPTAIKREDKGVAIAEGIDGELTVVRSFYISEESDRAIARQYAHLARPLPVQTDEDIVDAEVIW